MATAIDVLAVMDAIQRRLDTSFGMHSFPEYEEARAAVADSIPAMGGALHDLEAMIAAADRGEVWVVNAGTRARVEALRAALARVQGGAK